MNLVMGKVFGTSMRQNEKVKAKKGLTADAKFGRKLIHLFAFLIYFECYGLPTSIRLTVNMSML